MEDRLSTPFLHKVKNNNVLQQIGGASEDCGKSHLILSWNRDRKRVEMLSRGFRKCFSSGGWRFFRSVSNFSKKVKETLALHCTPPVFFVSYQDGNGSGTVSLHLCKLTRRHLVPSHRLEAKLSKWLFREFLSSSSSMHKLPTELP